MNMNSLFTGTQNDSLKYIFFESEIELQLTDLHVERTISLTTSYMTHQTVLFFFKEDGLFNPIGTTFCKNTAVISIFFNFHI